MNSPYEGKPVEKWLTTTKRLLKRHPLKTDLILPTAQHAWSSVWSTTVGTGKAAVKLTELDVPSSVVGYFFEVIFAKELEKRFPGIWRGCQQGEEKDLVYVPDRRWSVEIKTSGQLGTKVFGNRSYGQKTENQQLVKKEKSGFYITVNFFRHTLTLIRFGWIDATDWKAQASATGQMAGLPDEVYQHKLIPIGGDYRLLAPVQLVSGIGEKTAETLEVLGVKTVGDLLKTKASLPKKLERLREEIKDSYH